MVYFAKGKHFRIFSSRTYRKLYLEGYRQIVWENGDFILIEKNWIY